jgi:hypothetical protein
MTSMCPSRKGRGINGFAPLVEERGGADLEVASRQEDRRKIPLPPIENALSLDYSGVLFFSNFEVRVSDLFFRASGI